MSNLKFVFISIFLLLSICDLKSQTTDNVVWASLKVQHKINPKTIVAVAPILRLNNDISDYQNWSIDLSIKRLFAKGWHTQFLARTWFIPDTGERQFLWLDIGYKKTFPKSSIGSSLRLHYALDINDRTDGDFLRWKTSFAITKFEKIQPFINIEPWWQFNEFNELQRIRYEPGVKFSMKNNMNLTFIYRREATIDREPEVNFNMYVVTLTFSFAGK